MTTIHQGIRPYGVQFAHSGTHKTSTERPRAQTFARIDSLPPRDQATQFLDRLCQDVHSLMGFDPFGFPFQGGQATLTRIGPRAIVCEGPNDFYLEIVDRRITNKYGQSDSQIGAFLEAAKSALS